jgi:hypothetical protein
MRETCARVLAAALMTGAIATAMGLPTLFDGAGDLGPGVTAPPSSLQRSVRIPAHSAPPRPARAERLVTAQNVNPPATRPAAARTEPSRGAVEASRSNPRPSGSGRSGTPAPPVPATPAPTPPVPTSPAPAPETRELASSTPEPAAAPPAPTPPVATGEAGAKKKHKVKSNGNGNNNTTRKAEDQNDSCDAEEAAAPVPPAEAVPPVGAQPQEEPEGKEHGQGKGHDKTHGHEHDD